jgi:hypothetical protein
MTPTRCLVTLRYVRAHSKTLSLPATLLLIKTWISAGLFGTHPYVGKLIGERF